METFATGFAPSGVILPLANRIDLRFANNERFNAMLFFRAVVKGTPHAHFTSVATFRPTCLTVRLLLGAFESFAKIAPSRGLVEKTFPGKTVVGAVMKAIRFLVVSAVQFGTMIALTEI